MSKLIRYLLVTAALYGPFVYAADPVTVNQSDRKTMYGTAAVRPTPDTFDLASRGMCYVATDTGTVTEWTGTAWITTATCPGSATTSTNNSAGQYADDADFADGTSVGVLSQGVAESASPTAVTEGDVGAAAITLNRAWKSSLYTPNGDSAMDDTADAVKVLNYVTENAATATAADVDAADTPDDTVITVDTGAVAASRLVCAFLNTNVAANANIDEVNIILAPAGYDATGVPITYTEADFASPSGALLWVRTSQTAGADADATPDTTLPELGVLEFALDVGGVDSVTVTMSADADNAAVDAKCTFN